MHWNAALELAFRARKKTLRPKPLLSRPGHQEANSSRCNGERRMMDMRKRLSILAGLTAAGLVSGTIAAQAYTGEELASRARLDITQARTIALKAHPGTITDEELERERGGSGLRYSFDIKRGSVTQEVGVDARTGRVLENKMEGANPD